MDCVPIFLKLPAENIVQLLFIVENYEGDLGVLRTLDAGKGEVVIIAVKDTEKLTREVLKDIASDLQMREIPQPDSQKGDWLLSENFEFGLNS